MMIISSLVRIITTPIFFILPNPSTFRDVFKKSQHLYFGDNLKSTVRRMYHHTLTHTNDHIYDYTQ